MIRMGDDVIYERFCLFVEEILSCGCNSNLRFRDICTEIGVDSVRMENVLYGNVGMSGYELLKLLGAGNREVNS